MKPNIDDIRCGAVADICKAIKNCPVEAISYIEVEEAILDRNVVCTPKNDNKSSGCGCSCSCGDVQNNCNGSPYGRIIIDYNKCNSCGVCIDTCCGNAIIMVE